MSYGSMLHIPPTNSLLLTVKQEPYKKAYLLTKNIEEFSGNSSEERTSRQKKITQKEVCQPLFCPNQIIIPCDLQIDHIFHITLMYIIFQCDDAIVQCFFV